MAKSKKEKTLFSEKKILNLPYYIYQTLVLTPLPMVKLHYLPKLEENNTILPYLMKIKCQVFLIYISELTKKLNLELKERTKYTYQDTLKLMKMTMMKITLMMKIYLILLKNQKI